MSKMYNDINDDEIRIISSDNNAEKPSRRHGKWRVIAVLAAVAVVVLLLGLSFYQLVGLDDAADDTDELELVTESVVAKEALDSVESVSMTGSTAVKAHVEIVDTVVGYVPLTILTPVNATPALHVGTEVLHNDSAAVLVVQAADVRRDNGGIVGAYVNQGELLSKGQAKSGFCAIIAGKMTIGVADATPLLEQALETGGYFFRQYPLVVANQLVENKPRNVTLRKALAELNGMPVVVMSKEKMSFHDFSQALVDLGVSNAIYLIGSTAYGYVVDMDGNRVEFGKEVSPAAPNTNYLVWR